ncbi:MAG TPA: MFS transporter [Kofleriaceae bacterium]|nr:MFS transporter [Kofleriaceae bacterium]
MVSDVRLPTTQRAATMAIIVAALGYFVDIYDLILFGTIRRPSLIELGYTTKDQLTDQGLFLFNCQMSGLLVGGIVWGILADKRGRLSVLFGSIITYSIANLANGAVHNIEQYAVCRVIAGIGLAGELGAGITLVSELMHKHTRGIGTTIVAGFGICGGVAAGLVGGGVPSIYEGASWRTAFYIGGGLGLVLLLLRIGVVESGMFKTVATSANVSRGNFFALFRSRRRAVRYFALIGVGVPVWYVVGILITFCDRVGGELGVPDPRPATALMICYAGLAAGDLGSGLVSQWLKSRKRALALFIAGSALAVIGYFTLGTLSLAWFYAMCAALGLTVGYWAVFVTVAAEQFGTNLRGTVATTTPNFVRGSAVLVALGFEAISKQFDVVIGAIVMGVLSLGVAVLGLVGIHETFGVDLDYVEPDT